MTGAPDFPVVLFGFGKMGQGYAADPAMARHFRYAAHAQVLRDHPAVDWRAVVDPSPAARQAALAEWSVAEAYPDLLDAPSEIREATTLAVVATGPESRLGLLESLPNLRGVLVEKPLGVDAGAAEAFLEVCERRGIMVQVNLWRRADHTLRALADGQFDALIGPIQAATFYYGNGVLNNGTHLVDMARMLLGEVVQVRADWGTGIAEGPLPGDTNPRFALQFQSGLVADFQPLRFADYRENGAILWGERGRLDILAEGLVIQHFPREPHRAMQDEREVAIDQPISLPSGAGVALYDMFDNLVDAVVRDDPTRLVSPGRSALTTARVIEQIREAAAR